MATASTQPQFLDGIHTDPAGCIAEFYHYALNFFETLAPGRLMSLPRHDAEEVHSRIILHCISDDCRVLKLYRPEEGPFAGWFAILCLNKTKDYEKEVGRYRETVVAVGDYEISNHTDTLNANSSSPELATESREIIEIVAECLGLLDLYCRILVRLAADEFRPREIARVLRWSSEKAKKVSGDLPRCREKLRQLLMERGVE